MAWASRKILKGVRIGEGAVIGMGAIVTKDITPRSILDGIRAVLQILNKIHPTEIPRRHAPRHC